MALKETNEALSEPARPRARFACDLQWALTAQRTRPRARTPRMRFRGLESCYERIPRICMRGYDRP